MCEPTHSIVQFPDNDDDGNPTGSNLGGIAQKLGSVMKKVGKWLHLSKMGFGHSEGWQGATRSTLCYFPDHIKYEAHWWDRTTHRDGGIPNKYRALEKESLDAAEGYAHRVSIGTLPVLRQFLDETIQKTDRPHHYLDTFTRMLSVEGKNQFVAKLKKFFGLTPRDLFSWGIMTPKLRALQSQDKRKSVSAFVLGFTRKRALLVPEWADDDKLWLPPRVGEV